MRNDESNSEHLEYQEIHDLIDRYEHMLQGEKVMYFDVDEFDVIINYYLQNKDFDEALTAVNFAVNFFPDTSIFKIYRAEVLIQINENSKAFEILDQIEYFEPYNYQVNFTKAKANIKIENYNEATIQLEKALNKDKENELDLLLDISEYLIDESAFDFALKYLLRAYSLLSPKNSTLYQILYQIAYCYEQLKDWENSILFYEKYLDEDPFDAEIWHNLGTIHGRQNSHNKAIEAFDYALTINEKFGPSVYNKANTLANLGLYKDSIDVFNTFLEIEPQNLYARCTIAECYEKLDQYDEAIELYSKVITIDDSFSDAYYGLSIVKLRQELFDDSAYYISKALELDPENSDYLFGSGMLLYKINYMKDAFWAFQKTVEFNPYDFEAWLYMSDIKLNENEFEEALLILKKGYVHNNNIPQLVYRLAAIYYLLNDSSNCMFYLEKALLLNKELVSNYFFLICPNAENDINILNLYNPHKKI